MDKSLELECQTYFKRLEIELKAKKNEDTGKTRDNHFKNFSNVRGYEILKTGKMKVSGSDIISNPQMDNAAIKAFAGIPKPAKRKDFDFEHQFLIYEKHKGVYSPSKPFLFPGSGGKINFSCFMRERVDWSIVVAVAHSHPLYKKDPTRNRINKHFSKGDPFVVLAKQIPIYLRTPDGEDIRVLEVRSNWLTTRRISLTKTYTPKKWKPGH